MQVLGPCFALPFSLPVVELLQQRLSLISASSALSYRCVLLTPHFPHPGLKAGMDTELTSLTIFKYLICVELYVRLWEGHN